MTKVDIVEKIILATGYSKKDSLDIVEQVLEIMKETLASGEMIKISGFGNFVVTKKADRLGRNPVTGEPMTIVARRVLTFKASKVLRNAVNSEGEK